MDEIFNWLSDSMANGSDLLSVAIISALVSASVSYFFRTRETRHKLKTEYEYEQRKKLRDLIARYHGSLLAAANSFNYRMWNLYGNQTEGWLNVNGKWSRSQYYFLSSAYRFLNVCALIRKFEKEAVFVDARIAKRQDFKFLQYMAALRWCMTDVALFDGLQYDNFNETDHFFADTFRQYCDSFIKPDGSVIEFETFCDNVQSDHSYDPVLRFFDALNRLEKRLRWDRLVAFHLILAAFINTIGYKEHKTSQAKMNSIAGQICHREILSNLTSWLPRHGLKWGHARKIHRAAKCVK